LRVVNKSGGGYYPGYRSEGPFSQREEGWELGEEKESKKERERGKALIMKIKKPVDQSSRA